MTSPVTIHFGNHVEPPVTCDSRVQVELPVGKYYNTVWESLGVCWLEDDKPFLRRGMLPLGWDLREKPVTNFGERSFIILDKNNLPELEVVVKTSPWDKRAKINMIYGKRAEELKITLAPKTGQKEFNSLLAAYNRAVSTTYGMGSGGQIHIDSAYAELETFVKDHPDFRSDLPTKYKCYDDGCYGASGASIAFAETINKDSKCNIM